MIQKQLAGADCCQKQKPKILKKMKKCPYCGMQNEDENLFCTECGKPIPTNNVCPTCGAPINEGDVYCMECGKKIDEVPYSITKQPKCPHCGAFVNDGDVYCMECGKKIVEEGTITYPVKENEVYKQKVETKSAFKKYLPYIIGAVVLLGIIGVFASRGLSGSDSSLSDVADSMAINNNAPKDDSDAVIADYEEKMIYQGEYIFDAVLTDAAFEKKNSTFTIKIDGNNVTCPTDEGKGMSGHIYNDDLGIEVVYDYGDDLHWISLTIKPNDKEGKEWVGEFAFTGMRFDAVLKLKECRNRGEVVKVTEER